MAPLNESEQHIERTRADRYRLAVDSKLTLVGPDFEAAAIEAIRQVSPSKVQPCMIDICTSECKTCKAAGRCGSLARERVAPEPGPSFERGGALVPSYSGMRLRMTGATNFMSRRRPETSGATCSLHGCPVKDLQ